MKCEICNEADAAAAIEKDGEELYVCKACAEKERVKRQKRSQRTRKISRDGMEFTVTEISHGDDSGEGTEDAEDAPPFVKAIMSAFDGVISDLEKVAEDAEKTARTAKREVREFPVERSGAEFRIGNGLHLEGLCLIGELEAVHRATRALGMELTGVSADGIRESGHVYRLRYSGSAEQAKRVVEDILAQERNARIRLREEMPRVFGDSLCRALAILKNCRLLSPGELFDLLSPLRLAALEKMLDGLSIREVDRMLMKIDLSSREDSLTPEERDRIDSERADEMNARFEDVVLNESAEEKFL